ncbi:DedA family protein [Arthrobacter koreensis]|uniref:DedA family protein n=1 Tax=Arthrobacter koreensis TaxID=199136 RepID=UPI00363B3385
MVYPEVVSLATAAPAALQPKSSLLPEWLDPQVFLADPAIGPWVVLLICGIVFVETGLLIGFFLPGDSLLFTAGLLVATGAVQINIWVLILLIALSAFLGDQLGYLIGRKAGPVVFNRPESRFFHQENVDRAEAFFARHGGKAVVLARFIPVIRTFTPVVAGVGRMHYATFIAYNAIGGAVWALSVTLLGYILGDRVPFVRDNLDLIFLGVIGLTLVFVVAGLFRPGRRPQRTGKQQEVSEPESAPQEKGVRKPRPLPRPRPEAAAEED